MMLCPNCRTELEKARYCGHCGTPAGEGNFCGQCGTPYSGPNVCPRCGEILTDGMDDLLVVKTEPDERS